MKQNNIRTIQATPTITSGGAYAAGDLIGGKISLAEAVRSGGGSGVIKALALSDLGKQSAAIDVIFFDSDPEDTTFTNDSAFDPNDADLLRVVGWIEIVAADYSDFNDSSVARVVDEELPFKLENGKTLYAALVSRGTPTYTSTSDLTLSVHIEE